MNIKKRIILKGKHILFHLLVKRLLTQYEGTLSEIARSFCNDLNIEIKMGGDVFPSYPSLILSNAPGYVDGLALLHFFDIEKTNWIVAQRLFPMYKMFGDHFIPISAKNIEDVRFYVYQSFQRGRSISLFPSGGDKDRLGYHHVSMNMNPFGGGSVRILKMIPYDFPVYSVWISPQDVRALLQGSRKLKFLFDIIVLVLFKRCYSKKRVIKMEVNKTSALYFKEEIRNSVCDKKRLQKKFTDLFQRSY